MATIPHLYYIQSRIFQKKRIAVLIFALTIYVLTFLLFGQDLGVATNYIVLLPIITTSLSWGFWGGLISGVLGLPANILLFRLIAHPEFVPAVPLVAQISGTGVGAAFGGLSNYFILINQELERSNALLKILHEKVQEKEVLIQEIHHRVKNNINLILSILQLQERRNGIDPTVSMNIQRRIRAIASIHEHMKTTDKKSQVHLDTQIPALAQSLIESYAIPRLKLHTEFEAIPAIDIEQATPLSLILGEILTNACKYAFPDPNSGIAPQITIKGLPFTHPVSGRTMIQLEISDNGIGGEVLGCPDPDSGLGSQIIEALAQQLKAEMICGKEAGYHYVIRLPLPEENQESQA